MQPVHAVGSQVDGVAVSLEPALERMAQQFVVFDYQDAHSAIVPVKFEEMLKIAAPKPQTLNTVSMSFGIDRQSLNNR